MNDLRYYDILQAQILKQFKNSPESWPVFKLLLLEFLSIVQLSFVTLE